MIVLKDEENVPVGMRLKLHEKHGIMIIAVDAGGAADRTGMILTGDVITEINGTAISKNFSVKKAQDLLDFSTMSEIYIRE